MKTLLVLISFNLFCFHSSKNGQGNKICWKKNVLLSWKDYKGPLPNPMESYGARTFIVLRYEKKSDQSIIVLNCMIKNKSWANRRLISDKALIHEQYHFNIAEVYARKIREGMSFLKNPSSLVLDSIFNKYKEEHHNEQELYDKETSHSLNLVEQLNWQANVDNELIKLDMYTNSEVYLNLR